MKVHEYQAKSLLARYGVAVPRGEVADSAGQAREIAHRLSGRVVVKAQIHAGGRGKGVIFRKGKLHRTVPQEDLLPILLAEIDQVAAEKAEELGLTAKV